MKYMTFRKVCEYAGVDYKKTIDDRANGADFILTGANGRAICDTDDCVATMAYARMREQGHKVRVAGTMAKRLREAMRDYPDAEQLTTVTLLNGLTFTQPASDLDLSTGYISGGFMLSATVFDVRNFRDLVRQAIEAEVTVIGGEDV